MAAGVLTAEEITTVTLDARAYNVTVTTDGAEIWFTTDGSNPDYQKDRAHRVRFEGTVTVPVDSGADPTVVKLRSRQAPGYTVTAVALTSEETGFPVAEQSGASVADAAVIAYTTDDVTGGDLAFDTPGTSVGTDIVIDGDGNLHFAVAQRAVIALDLNLVTDATADGFLKVDVDYDTLPDVSFLSWGNDKLIIPVYPSLSYPSALTLPDDAFLEGSTLTFSVTHVGAGTVTVQGGGSMIYARRTA